MNKKHILVIEDDEGISAITRFSLEMEGNWQVTTASKGKEGLIKAKELHPDVILLDIVLPDISGINIIKNLQKSNFTEAIPIVLLTAKKLQYNLANLKNNSIKGIITKPFDCLTLSTKILTLLETS